MYREQNTSLINSQSDFSLLTALNPYFSYLCVCGGGGGRYITSSYIPSYKKTSYNITRSMCKLAYTARLNDRNIFLEYSLITGADVKNISLNNGMIPCAKLVIIIEQGIISLVK